MDTFPTPGGDNRDVDDDYDDNHDDDDDHHHHHDENDYDVDDDHHCTMCCLSSWVPLYTKMPCVVYRGIEAFEAFSTRLLCIIYRISVYDTAPYLAQN